VKAELKKSTLLFLIEKDSVLLAMKKRGFGEGRWNGVGGKPEPGETIEQTAIRECEEEIEVIPGEFAQVATLNFYFPSTKADWNQQVIVYLCSKWRGVPKETEEMKPMWHKIADIPYDDMWKDDRYWLPEVLRGNFVSATFEFDDEDNVLNHNLVLSSLRT
jgi:mutator protein MutT